jgi:hypothetical protein
LADFWVGSFLGVLHPDSDRWGSSRGVAGVVIVVVEGVSWWCFCVFLFQVVRFVYLQRVVDGREVYTNPRELGLELGEVLMCQALCGERRGGEWVLRVHVLGCLDCGSAFEVNSC